MGASIAGVVGSSRFPWAETAGFTVLIPAFNFGMNIGDPFLLQGGFPWLVVVPLLIGLRHGPAHALVSSLVLIVAISLGMRLGYVPLGDYPAGVTIAILVLGLVGGEYKTYWSTRIDRVTDSEQYYKARLDQFAKIYHMLKQSHDRLEHQVSANVRCIRSALTDLHGQFTSLQPSPDTAFLGAAENILKLMSDHGQVQIAALYEILPNGNLAGTPAARLGKPLPVSPEDPLLREARRLKQTVALSPDQEIQETTLMAAVPIVDYAGRLWGVVTVNELPFVALEANNLNLLSVFGGHIGDCLTRWSKCRSTTPHAIVQFHRELGRAMADASRCETPAVVLALSVAGNWETNGLLEKVMLGCRGLDRLLIGQTENGVVTLLKLMPNTGRMGAERYLWRLEKLVKTRLGHSLNSAGMSLKIVELDGRVDRDEIARELAPWLARLAPSSPEHAREDRVAGLGGVRC